MERGSSSEGKEKDSGEKKYGDVEVEGEGEGEANGKDNGEKEKEYRDVEGEGEGEGNGKDNGEKEKEYRDVEGEGEGNGKDNGEKEKEYRDVEGKGEGEGNGKEAGEKKYRGVERTSSGKYTAKIFAKKKCTLLATYDTAEEAARHYDFAALCENHQAELNFPEEKQKHITLSASDLAKFDRSWNEILEEFPKTPERSGTVAPGEEGVRYRDDVPRVNPNDTSSSSGLFRDDVIIDLGERTFDQWIEDAMKEIDDVPGAEANEVENSGTDAGSSSALVGQDRINDSSQLTDAQFWDLVRDSGVMDEEEGEKNGNKN